MDEILVGNVHYTKHIDRWRFLYSSYVGGQQYRDGGYLTRYQNESDSEYAARCNATPLDNQCKSIIQIYNSFLFRDGVDRQLGQIEYLPDVEDFIDDADMDNRSLDNFMKEVSTWAGVFGHCWVIVSKPNVGAVTLADEKALGIRPYVSLLTPLVVLDWKYDRSINGKYELSYLRYIEDVNNSIHVVKEWTKDDITTIEYDVDTKKTLATYTESNGIGIIPAVCCYADRSITRGIGISSIDDISDLQRYIYNALSEADQSIRLDSHPSLVATEETLIGTGAGSLIQIPNNITSDTKPYILDFNGASIQSIYEVISNTTTAIERVACIGGIRAKETRTLSGVALEVEFGMLNNRLSAIADNLEDAEEAIWELYCLYQNYPSCCVEIKYPDSFNVKDSDREIDQLVKIKSAATDPRVLAAVDMELLDWLDLDEDELLALNNVLIMNPNSIPSEEDYVIFEPTQMINEMGNIVDVNSVEEQMQYAKQGYIKMD